MQRSTELMRPPSLPFSTVVNNPTASPHRSLVSPRLAGVASVRASANERGQRGLIMSTLIHDADDLYRPAEVMTSRIVGGAHSDFTQPVRQESWQGSV
jgi:hypothetical protein